MISMENWARVGLGYGSTPRPGGQREAGWKFASNQARDQLVTQTLRSAKWRVLRIWEHELARKNEIRLLRRIQRALI